MTNVTEQMSIPSVSDHADACAFTGHRELSETFRKSRLKKSIETLILNGVTTFYDGGAMGFDLIAAECTLELKKKYPFVKLVVCVPCADQDKSFPPEDKKRYAKILEKCDEKVLLAEHYYRGCMQARNRYMVDRSGHMIAHLYKSEGGTAYTVKYFRNLRKKDPIQV